MQNPIIPLYKRLDKVIVEAKGCLMIDADGKRYVDFESGDWAAVLGHSHPRMLNALRAQMEISIHDGLQYRNRPSEELSLALLEVLDLPGGQSAFLNSGSEAVNLGITLAKHLTGREKVLKIAGTFLSSYGHGQISPANKNLLDVPMDDLAAVAGIDFSQIAAFVLEPGNTWGLVKYPAPAFVEALVSAAAENGALVIANEVTTGFGRTGKWFGSQHYAVRPDVMITGKGLGNGYPISAVSLSARTAQRFAANGMRYAQSHQNDPLGCAVGLEVIRTMREESLVEAGARKGDHFLARLNVLKDTHPAQVKEARGRGMMHALEVFPSVDAASLHASLAEAGFITGLHEHTLRFMPPLTIPQESIDALTDTIDGLLG